MSTMKYFQAAALALATLGFGLSAPEASAGSCSNRGYSHGGGWHVSVDFGSHRHHGHRSHTRVVYQSHHRDYGHHRGYHHRGYSHQRVTHHRNVGHHRSASRCDVPVRHVVHHQRPSGYWSQQWVPPVYQTRYYACGTPYRVCVRAGYYKKVWVSYRY